MPNATKETRREIAIAIVERCNMLEAPRKTCFVIARNFLQGARKMAALLGDDETAQDMTEAYAQVTEAGYKTVLKWAGVNDTVGNGNLREAA